MSHLRNIALTVDEGDPGQFTWILTESLGDAVVFDKEISVSGEPYNSYIAAMDAGVRAWKRFVGDDIIHGPRATGRDESGSLFGRLDARAI